MGRISQIKILFLALLLSICVPLRTAADGKDGLKTVCIDAGHGGHDPGCISADRKTREKDLTLSIAQKLAAEIRKNNPDVKVVMTRDSDKYVTLNGRADIANKANADLFISIHINAAANKSASGFSVHCLGQSSVKGRDLFSNNMEIVKRENSVILLEEDYSSKYQGFDPNDPESFIFFNLMQNAHLEQSLLFADEVAQALKNGPVRKNRGISQDPFLVLWRTAMPAVLVECGFMTNASDLANMKTAENQKKIAHQLYNAFVSFKKKYDASIGGQAASSTAEAPAPATETAAAPAAEDHPEAVVTGATGSFGTQVLASGRKMKAGDPYFKGYDAFAVWTGKLYKYVIGVRSSEKEAREEFKKIKKFFPDGFLVRIEDENTVRIP
ncbi:MAG: N-acetylmuramoyl-L-alanine amidase [Bacteroidales bacterium]|nr:N-acetylmuramoyl-L-alanine amidase [Bacteroidales bacterium]